MDYATITVQALKVAAFVKLHWPFFLYTAIFAFVGEVSRRKWFTPENVEKLNQAAHKLLGQTGAGSKVLGAVAWFLSSFPLEFHPLAAGLILGLIPGVPVSVGGYGIPSVLYCVSAGIASTKLYDYMHMAFAFVWKYVLRREEPVPDIDLPGEADESTEDEK